MGLGTLWSLWLEDHNWENDKLPVDLALVWDTLQQLHAHKSMWPDGIHPRVLGELDDVIVRHFCYLSRVLGLWRGPSQVEVSKCYSNFQER